MEAFIHSFTHSFVRSFNMCACVYVDRWVEESLKEDPDFFKKLKHGQVSKRREERKKSVCALVWV
jgi:hypothetical protein